MASSYCSGYNVGAAYTLSNVTAGTWYANNTKVLVPFTLGLNTSDWQISSNTYGLQYIGTPTIVVRCDYFTGNSPESLTGAAMEVAIFKNSTVLTNAMIIGGFQVASGVLNLPISICQFVSVSTNDILYPGYSLPFQSTAGTAWAYTQSFLSVNRIG